MNYPLFVQVVLCICAVVMLGLLFAHIVGHGQ